jgi:SAM-dependent methyltransferase
MIDKLRRWKRKQEFNPDILGLFINPFYFARQGLYKNISKYAPAMSGKVLDVGCGQKPYEHLFKTTSYTGMDIEQSGHSHEQENIDVFYDGKTFPFENESFDNIITNQVFEHVFNPTEFLSEIHRVLKPEGNLLLTVPFVWDEHEQPYDFARYSSFGIRHVLEAHGFQIISLTKSVNDSRVVFQLWILFIYKKVITQNRWLNKIIIFFLISPVTIAGLIIAKILPSNADLYLDNIVLAKKVRLK